MKKFYPFAGILTILGFYAGAQVVGPLSPNSFATSAIVGSTTTWSNTSNVQSSDDVRASTGNLTSTNTYSDYLVVTNFGFSVTPALTISGIQVLVERSASSSFLLSDYSVRLVKNGVIQSTDKASSAAWLTSDQIQSYGGSTDVWGDSWTGADINSTGFGFAIAAEKTVSGSSTSASIDNIQIVVFYEVPLPLKLQAFAGRVQEKNVRLEWTTSQEQNTDYFEIQRSSDGLNFTTFRKVDAGGTTFDSRTYSAVDNLPLAGKAFYRLKVFDDNGQYSYSNIISLNVPLSAAIKIFPTFLPADRTVRFAGPSGKSFTLLIYNATGQQVFRREHAQDANTFMLRLRQNGIYYYRVFDEDRQQVSTGRLMVQ